MDLALCSDLAQLEPASEAGTLSTAEKACLERRVGASADQVDRDFTSRLLIRDAQVRMAAGAPCADFDRLVERHLDQISRGDAALLYTWVTHLSSRHPGRTDDILRWSERALDNKDQLGEGAPFTDKVGKLYRARARAATEKWIVAQNTYLQNGRTPELEAVEATQRARAKSTAREWLEFLTAAGRDGTEARTLCATASGSEACAVD